MVKRAVCIEDEEAVDFVSHPLSVLECDCCVGGCHHENRRFSCEGETAVQHSPVHSGAERMAFAMGLQCMGRESAELVRMASSYERAG